MGPVLRVAATYIGTVVGAGFASGQETLRFFAAYGQRGLWGAVLSAALFCFYGVVVLELGHTLQARSHREVLVHVCGRAVGNVLDAAVTCFLFASLAVMIAGGGALVHEQLHLSGVLGSTITAVATAITVLTGLSGILAANTVVVPLLAISVLGLSLGHVAHGAATPSLPLRALQAGPNWFVASWLYVAYNLILSLSVLAPMGAGISRRSVRWAGALLGGAGLGVLAVCIHLALSAHLPEAARWQLPLLYLARALPSPMQWAYTLVLWAEIYTTAIASAFGCARRLADASGFPYTGAVLVCVVLATLGSQLGFSNLVSTVYPAFGYASVGLLILLMRYSGAVLGPRA